MMMEGLLCNQLPNIRVQETVSESSLRREGAHFVRRLGEGATEELGRSRILRDACCNGYILSKRSPSKVTLSVC